MRWVLYGEGQIRTRKYNDKDGVEKYTTHIRVDQMQMLGSRKARTVSFGRDDDGSYSKSRRASTTWTTTCRHSCDEPRADLKK